MRSPRKEVRLRKLCESKVQQLYSGLSDQDIGRFQIAVNDPLCVRSVETVCDLYRHGQRLRQRQRAGERLALDVLHDEVVRAYIIERAYVRVVQGGDGMRFACESVREFCSRELDGNSAVQTRVSGLPHLAHATCSDNGLEFVRTETPSDCRAAHGGLLYPLQIVIHTSLVRLLWCDYQRILTGSVCV